MELTTIQTVAMWTIPILFAVTVHEVAHGYAAYLLGDRTAFMLGRLTLNPIKHIDFLGSIVIPLVLLLTHSGIIMGWAKPVPIGHRNLHNLRRDFALIAIAGPLSNLIMAFIWAGLAKVASILMPLNFPGAFAVYMMGVAGIGINVMLIVMNLLPIPPLDGGHILASLMPRIIAVQYERIAPFGFLILFGLLAFGLINSVLRPAMSFLFSLIGAMFNLSLPL